MNMKNAHESNDLAIETVKISKIYKLYNSVAEQAIDVLGLSNIFFWRRIEPQRFSALDDINLTVKQGERLGIIGRNGAGKTTLLKILTESVLPTEGVLKINGKIQALMEVGLGFHPEFTGLENIRASLLYSGLDTAGYAAAEANIVEFCELGDFLDQPLKTYSLGMQGRLQFACATAVKPEILIVDEILGAGDAYFSAKSALRMEHLTKSGCTLLLVSHSMGQIMQFCERVIWIESGHVIADGGAREIVNRYESFIHELRRKAKITEAEQLADVNQSEWLRIKTLEALKATHDSINKKNGEKNSSPGVVRWPQDGSPIEITSMRLRGRGEKQSTFFQVGDPMIFEIEITALKSGRFPCRYAIVIFTSDGRLVVRHVSGWFQHQMKAGERRVVRMHYDTILLGSGDYFFSLAAYERLNLRNMNEYRWYDLHSRAYDFTIAENAIDPVSLVHHPSRWALVAAPPGEFEECVGPDYSENLE